MMGYSENSKSYQLFDFVKQQIIIMRNVIFDEKSSGLKLLNSPFCILNNDPFDIVPNSRSPTPLLCISTNSLTSLLKSTGSHTTPIETITSLD